MVTARGSIMALSSCRRSGVSACIGESSELRARPRRSPSAGKRMAGSWQSPVPTCWYTHCHPRARRQVSMWAWSRSPRWPTGESICTPACYRKAEAYLRRCQRRVARRKKGSHRRRKAAALLSKAHQHVRNQRRDFHHKGCACKLVRENDTIYHEDLRVGNMVKNHHLAKSIKDAGWSAFLTILTFKAASAGKRVQAVNPAFTSQVCSELWCDRRDKGLSVRWHSCPECGASLHRDHNAARNILSHARRPADTDICEPG